MLSLCIIIFGLVPKDKVMDKTILTIRIEQTDNKMFVGYIKETPNLFRMEGNNLMEVYNGVRDQVAYILHEMINIANIKIHTEFCLRFTDQGKYCTT